MKLELKHIAPYLPFELGITPIWRSMYMGGYSQKKLTPYILDNYGLDEIEPILRPLSDLTKEINYGLSTYSFTDLFEIGDCDGCVFEFEHGNIKTIKALEDISKYNLHNDINYLPNAVVNMMYEYHFDVFGLIDHGLAIDINTI